jgi:hypothetical protein
MANIIENDAVVANHAEFEQRCHTLHDVLTRNDQSLAMADSVAKELCRQICSSFRREEVDYLHEVNRRAPWLAESAKALQLQHRQLRQLLDNIISRLERDRLSPLERMELSADFDSFVLKFQEHEERENQLLQEAFDRDVGNKD